MKSSVIVSLILFLMSPIFCEEFDNEGFFEQMIRGFVKGTLINTEEGYKPIEKIKPGDCVYSYNGANFLYISVYEIKKSICKTLAKITLEDETVFYARPFQNIKSPAGWTFPIDLKKGAWLSCFNKGIGILNIEEIVGNFEVYELMLEDYGIFYVTVHGIVAYQESWAEAWNEVKRGTKAVGRFGLDVGKTVLAALILRG